MGLERWRPGLDLEALEKRVSLAPETALLRVPRLMKPCLGPGETSSIRGDALSPSPPCPVHSVWSHWLSIRQP